ncbi:MAG: hypothetical protein D6696_15060 [Acidobacteria bacterium]|nr:MAG: hypothetical protein D6696_15060 [Acidobacteriota bacterium]
MWPQRIRFSLDVRCAALAACLALLGPPPPAAAASPAAVSPVAEAWRDFLAVALRGPDGRRPEPLVIEDAYRLALRHWGSGRLELGGGLLVDLEQRFAGSEERACIDRLERHTFERLLDAEPEAGLVVMGLHVALWAEQVKQRHFALAIGTEQRLEGWIDAYAEAAGEAAAEPLAWLLVHWGEVKGWSLYPAGAEELLARAAALAPLRTEAPRLSILLAEKTWRYNAAVAWAERLLAIVPGDPEAALRHAVNLARTGKEEASRAELAALAAGDAEPWVRILAYEELARLETRRGAPGRAIALLQEATGRFPRSEQLALQLAHALRRRDGRPSPLAVEILDAWQGDAGPSPRVRYDSEPRRIDGLRQHLQAALDRRRPLLARTLEAIEADDGTRIKAPHCWGKLRLLR